VNFAVTYASYFALFVALGIPMYGMREIAIQNNNPEGRSRTVSELFTINVLSAIIFSTVYLVTVFSVPTLSQNKEFLLITGISVLFVPFNVDWFFSGREKFKLVTLRTLAAKVIALGGLFIFVRTRENIVPYLILTVAANLSSQIWNFGYMLKTEVRLQIKHLQIRKHLKAVLILFASNIAISIYTMLSTLLLGFLSDYTQVGYYTSAIKVSNIILPVVVAMSPVMIARINTIKGEKDSQTEILRLLNNSFGYMMMLAVPATIGLIMIAPRFVPLFFGAEFIPATISLQVLALGNF
jgi:O-antigen/teichoic acid export membrane protein